MDAPRYSNKKVIQAAGNNSSGDLGVQPSKWFNDIRQLLLMMELIDAKLPA